MPVDLPGTVIEDPDIKRFSSQDPYNFDLAVEGLARLYPDVPKSRVGDLVNIHAAEWPGSGFPAGFDLVQDDRLNRVLGQHASGLLSVVPVGTFSIDGAVFFNDPTGINGIVKTGAEDPRVVPSSFPGSIGRFLEFSRFVPQFTSDEIGARIAAIKKPVPTGRGGGGALPPTFDLDQIGESYRQLHRSLLLEDPGDSSALAKRYQSEFRAFAKSGGQLDFQTWAMKQIRASSKYGILYAKKPEFLEESEYMAQYFNAASASGLSAVRVKQETEAGLTAGTSAGGFAERVSRTQGVDTGGAGFGRQLANLASQMQLGATG